LQTLWAVLKSRLSRGISGFFGTHPVARRLPPGQRPERWPQPALVPRLVKVPALHSARRLPRERLPLPDRQLVR